MKPVKLRLFFGVPVSEATREKMMAAVTDLNPRSIRMTLPENLHTTIEFLGDVDEPDVEFIIARAKRGLGKLETGPLHYTHTGVFRTGSRRIFWFGLKDPWLTAVSRSLKTALGIPNDEFHPHVTVARAKAMTGPVRRFEKSFLELSSVPLIQDRSRIVLYQSILGPEGPNYIEKYCWPEE